MRGDGKTLYAWLARHDDPRVGWTQISAHMPGIGNIVCTHVNEDVARGKLREIAMLHATMSKQPIKLVKFTEAEALESMAPDE